MNRSKWCFVLAVLTFVVGAVVAVGWFGSDATIADLLAVGFVGSAFFAAGHIPA